MAIARKIFTKKAANNKKQIIAEIEQIIDRLTEIKEVLLSDEPETEKSLFEQVTGGKQWIPNF